MMGSCHCCFKEDGCGHNATCPIGRIADLEDQNTELATALQTARETIRSGVVKLIEVDEVAAANEVFTALRKIPIPASILAGEMAQQRQRIRELENQKNGAYSERDRLVCALSKVFPSSLERHPDSDRSWDDDWRWIVFVDLPTGQATWHIHDSELNWFDHLPRKTGREWDGHTTDEKYARLEALAGKGK
jgi:hypothetical protein